MTPLVFCPSSSLYGASRAIAYATTGLKDRGHCPTLALSDRTGPLWNYVKEIGIDLLEADSKCWLTTSGGLVKGVRRHVKNRSMAHRFVRRLGERKFDVVHSNTLNTPFGAMVAQELALPHLWQMHESLGTSKNDRLLLGIRQARRFIEATADLIIVNSRFTLERSKSYCPENLLRLVYYGCFNEDDERAEVPSRPPFDLAGPIRLILVGSIQPRKGQEDAIRALGLLAAQGLNVQLKLVGDGNEAYVAQMRKLAAEVGVSDRIEWCGFQNDPDPFYETSDIALVCSRGEPFGIVTIESLSKGVVTIGANSGGILEVIEDGVNGLLYDVEQPQHLAAQIRRVAGNGDFRRRMVEAGYRSAFARFGTQRYAADIEHAYEDTIEGFRKRRR